MQIYQFNSIQLTEIKETLESVKKRGSVLEDSCKVIKGEIDGLKETVQLINEHTCPEAMAPPSSLQPASSRNAAFSTDMDSPASPAMTPNTLSPHFPLLQNQTTPHLPECSPYETYCEDLITSDMREKLLALLKEEEGNFKEVGNSSREVLYYGEHGYWYTGAYHEANETPIVVQELMDLVRPKLKDPKTWINSCLVTRYKDGQSHIPMHRDDEGAIDPNSTSVIATVSIGAERTLSFTNGVKSEDLAVKDGSLYVMSRFSQDFWQHGIKPVDSTDTAGISSVVESDSANDKPISEQDEDVVHEPRYSFTFRHIAPYFNNSTCIIGDSNTQNLKFGKDLGTFGAWLPGKRVKAAKIEDIPSPEDIGPFRNIVLHTGINNIVDNNRKSNRSLVSILKSKRDKIQSFYPKSKLYISLLLPTKSTFINNRVNELNSLILDMAFGSKNMYIIDNSSIGTESGCMPGKYGRFFRNGMANATDAVHLGKLGLRIFCKNIKGSIVGKGRNQSEERFRGGNGDYRSAAWRGRRSSILTR